MTHAWQATCPFCGATHNMASNATRTEEGPIQPRNGDLTLCINCGEWAFFDQNAKGGLRKPTDAEYRRIAASPHSRLAREAWIEIAKINLEKKRWLH